MPLRLEKEFRLPESNTDACVADQQSRVAVVVTHPWGPLGGNMHNNVVVAAVLYFQKLGITTARFDFNGGVGRGYPQVAQVLQVARGLLQGKFLDTVAAPSSSPPSKIILIGYSYGSLIAGSATADLPECVASISIAPPFSVQHWLLMFNSTHHLGQATERVDLPRLLLIGTDDNFTSEKVFKSTVEDKYPTSVTTGAVIKGADHFFRHREKDLMDVIGQWLLETFSECSGDLRRLGEAVMGTRSPS